MRLQVEINGQWQDVTPQQLKAMALTRRITSETRVRGNEKVVLAANVKGLEFPVEEEYVLTSVAETEDNPEIVTESVSPEKDKAEEKGGACLGCFMILLVPVIGCIVSLINEGTQHNYPSSSGNSTTKPVAGYGNYSSPQSSQQQFSDEEVMDILLPLIQEEIANSPRSYSDGTCRSCSGRGEYAGHRCLTCGGRGEIPDPTGKCLKCNGVGRKDSCPNCWGRGRLQAPTPYGGYQTLACTACSGTGKLMCRYCNGRGTR